MFYSANRRKKGNARVIKIDQRKSLPTMNQIQDGQMETNR